MLARLATVISFLFSLSTASEAALPPGVGYPSPWAVGGDGWDEAIAKANDFVGQMTLVEKVNLTTGTGWEADLCVGNTGSVPRLGFRGLCLEDGPLGVRDSMAVPITFHFSSSPEKTFV
jgi:beta-glucosidase